MLQNPRFANLFIEQLQQNLRDSYTIRSGDTAAERRTCNPQSTVYSHRQLAAAVPVAVRVALHQFRHLNSLKMLSMAGAAKIVYQALALALCGATHCDVDTWTLLATRCGVLEDKWWPEPEGSREATGLRYHVPPAYVALALWGFGADPVHTGVPGGEGGYSFERLVFDAVSIYAAMPDVTVEMIEQQLLAQQQEEAQNAQQQRDAEKLRLKLPSAADMWRALPLLRRAVVNGLMAEQQQRGILRGIFLASVIGVDEPVRKPDTPAAAASRRAATTSVVAADDSAIAALKEAVQQPPAPSIVMCLNGLGAHFADVIVMSPRKLVLVSCKKGSAGEPAKQLATMGAFLPLTHVASTQEVTRLHRVKYTQLLVEFCLSILAAEQPPPDAAAAVDQLRRCFTMPTAAGGAAAAAEGNCFKVEFVILYGKATENGARYRICSSAIETTRPFSSTDRRRRLGYGWHECR
jgi:hypothetical protein